MVTRPNVPEAAFVNLSESVLYFSDEYLRQVEQENKYFSGTEIVDDCILWCDIAPLVPRTVKTKSFVFRVPTVQLNS